MSTRVTVPYCPGAALQPLEMEFRPFVVEFRPVKPPADGTVVGGSTTGGLVTGGWLTGAAPDVGVGATVVAGVPGKVIGA